MTDLISRKALLERMHSIVFNGIPLGTQYGVQIGCDAMENVVRSAPAVDAVEVIRCKDCAEYIPWLYGERICGKVGSYYGNTKPNDYCSRGRKRE